MSELKTHTTRPVLCSWTLVFFQSFQIMGFQMTVWYDPSSTSTPTFANGWSVFSQTTLNSLLDSTSNVALGTAAAAPSTLAILGSTGINNVKNSSFESGSGLTDWVTKGAAQSIADATATQGARLLRLGATKSGEIAQDISTEVDKYYTLVFTAASVSSATQRLSIELTSVASGLTSTIESRTFSVAGTERKAYTFTFRAMSDLSRLRLSAEAGKGLNIDNIRIVKTESDGLNYLKNGDFEAGNTGTGVAEGWIIETSSGVSINETRATSGSRFLALGGWTNGSGAVSQSFPTEDGAIYSLSFAVKSYRTAQNLSLRISSQLNVSPASILTDSLTINGALRLSYTFMAQSTTTNLRFETAASMGDLDLDDVRVVRLMVGSDNIINGSFEDQNAAPDAEDVSPPDTSSAQGAAFVIEGWILADGSGVIVDATQAKTDSALLALGNNTAEGGSASQVIKTRSGSVYTLTFSANAIRVAQSATIDIQSVNDDGVVTSSIATRTTNISTGGYKIFSVTFTARSDITRVSFSTSASKGDLYLDDISMRRVAGKQDQFSNVAEALEYDAYIAGSSARMLAASQALGTGFSDPAQRRWWALERFDSGLDTDMRLFDERAYFDLNPSAASWEGTALEHYFASGWKTKAIIAPVVSPAALAIDADAYLAASPSMIQAAKRELGANINNSSLRAYWARVYYDAHSSIGDSIDYFDADTYLKMYPDLATSWAGSAEEHFILSGQSRGNLLPLQSMGAASLDVDIYLAAIPGLSARAMAELGDSYADQTQRQAWALRDYVGGGYQRPAQIKAYFATVIAPPPKLDDESYYDELGYIMRDNNVYYTTNGFAKITRLILSEIETLKDHPTHPFTLQWFEQVILEFLDSLKNDKVYLEIRSWRPEFNTQWYELRQLANARTSNGMDIHSYLGTLDGSADNALKIVMPTIAWLCPSLIHLADSVADYAETAFGSGLEVLTNSNANRNVKTILGYMNKYDVRYSNALSLYEHGQRATELRESLEGASKVLGVTAGNPATEARHLLAAEPVLRRRLASYVLSSFNINPGTVGYNSSLRYVFSWIEATGNKLTLIYLRLMNAIVHPGSGQLISAIKGTIDTMKKAPMFSLLGRAIPASAMFAFTFAAFLGNISSSYVQKTYAGFARAVALCLYGVGSILRLSSLDVESRAVREFQGWLQKKAFFRALVESPASAAIITDRMANHAVAQFTTEEIAALRLHALHGGAAPVQANSYAASLTRFNQTIALSTSKGYKALMGGFFALADIAVGVQNVLDSAAKFEKGKPISGSLYAVTAAFNFGSGACGFMALMCVANPPLAAALTAGVLVLSVASFFTNVAAMIVDG